MQVSSDRPAPNRRSQRFVGAERLQSWGLALKGTSRCVAVESAQKATAKVNTKTNYEGASARMLSRNKMVMIGSGLLLIGIFVGLAGFGGFFDSRKVDRRFKTGYKNNEPDNRDFGRSGKRVLYGIGTCIVGAAVLSLSSHSDRSASSANAAPDIAQLQPTVVSAAPAAPKNVVQLDPAPLEQKTNSGVTLGSNERVVSAAEMQGGSAPAQNVAVSARQVPSPQLDTPSAQCVEDGTFFGSNVCKSGTLAAAYELELKEYDAAQARIGGKDVGIRIEQERWLDQVVRACPDMTCLTNAFDARVSDLRGRYKNDG